MTRKKPMKHLNKDDGENGIVAWITLIYVWSHFIVQPNLNAACTQC